MHNNYLDKIIMENENTFHCLLIKPCNIENISWLDIDYPKKIANLNTYDYIDTNSSNFIEVISIQLGIDKLQLPNLSIKNQIIAEEADYIYELLYIDLDNFKDYHIDNNKNDIASLLNTNGDIIYFNALLFKTCIKNTLLFVDITTSDIQNILYDRVNTKIVIWDWDNKWKEIKVKGNLNNYAKLFFEDYDYKKMEIGFLLHNINIWYINDEYGDKNICGSLIDKPLEKCLWFTLISDDLRGNLTLDEVNKIIYLSTKLSSFNVPNDLLEEKLDKFGRKIINNKYKILDYLYNKYK